MLRGKMNVYIYVNDISILVKIWYIYPKLVFSDKGRARVKDKRALLVAYTFKCPKKKKKMVAMINFSLVKEY